MIKIRTVELRRVALKTRMPFRYGIAVLTAAPHAFVVVEAEIDGIVQRGITADHLPLKWLTKDPDRDPADEIVDMIDVIHHAVGFARELSAPTVFEFWEKLYRAQAAWGAPAGYPPLLYHFGTSLVERALIDAFCRARGEPFHELLRSNAFGVELGRLFPELRGTAPADWLPKEPLDSVACRHTVGLADALTDEEIPAADVLRDGLPQSLVACIHHYGLRQFKIKFTADRAASIPRLRRIAAILERETRGDYAASLDGNESFHHVKDFREYWAEAKALPELQGLFQKLLFVEQPFHRQIALSAEVREGMSGWAERPLIIIDESDAEIESLPQALACGYAGTSHKNCKGVFHGVANACLLAQRRRAGLSGFMSGEDLTNIGPVSLPQDLAVQAALGNESVERNGHHYFRGLSFWPEVIQQEALAHHGDLYRRSLQGWPTLAVEKGRIQLGSVNRAPFGIATLPAVAGFDPF